MKLVTFLVPISLLCVFVRAQSEVVEFGRCPNQCLDISKSPEVFTSCAPLFQLDCLLLPCGDLGFVSCRLPTDPVPSGPLEVVPGARIEFEELTVGKPFPIFINFAANRKSLPVDIYFLADNTGSMASAISTVKRRFFEVINAVKADPRFEDPKFGVGAYQDESSPRTDEGFIHLQSLTSDSAIAQAAVNRYVATGGGDRDEANLVALYKVAKDARIGWRDQTRKVVVYFGDVPGHEPTCGSFGTLTRERVVDELNKNSISVICVSLDTGIFDSAPITVFKCSGTPAGSGQASFITSRTKGNLQNGDATTIVDKIKDGIAVLTSTFTADISDCNGKLVTTFGPNLPLTLAPNMKQIVTQTVEVPASFCGGISTAFTCTVKYQESGVGLDPTTIVARKIRGC